MGRNPRWWEFMSVTLALVLALALGPVACSEKNGGIVGPDNPASEVTPLKYVVSAQDGRGQTKNDFSLSERPLLTARLLAFDPEVELEVIVDDFPFLVTWTGDAVALANCDIYGPTGANFTSVRCRAPGLPTFCAESQVNNRLVRGCVKIAIQ